jgi:hypothetical protein
MRGVEVQITNAALSAEQLAPDGCQDLNTRTMHRVAGTWDECVARCRFEVSRGFRVSIHFWLITSQSEAAKLVENRVYPLPHQHKLNALLCKRDARKL